MISSYYQGMCDVSQTVDKIIDQAFDSLRSSTQEPSQRLLEEMREERVGAPRLRDYLLHESYVACSGEQAPKAVYELAAAAEIYNMSTYMVNWFLDNKGTLNDEADRRRAVIQGSRLHELSRGVIRSSTLPDDLKNCALDRFSVINRQVYRGQAADFDTLNISQGAHLLAPEEYLHKYLDMCDDKSGVFFSQITALGAEVARASRDECWALEYYGYKLGVGLQVVNDVSDLVASISDSRAHADRFSDVENGLVTLPLYSLLQDDSSFTEYFGRSLDGCERTRLYDALLEHQSFDSSFRVGSYLRKHELKTVLRNYFSKGRRRNLSTASAVLTSSTYHHEVRQNSGYTYEGNLVSGLEGVLRSR